VQSLNAAGEGNMGVEGYVGVVDFLVLEGNAAPIVVPGCSKEALKARIKLLAN
jgi:hypothetical protein